MPKRSKSAWLTAWLLAALLAAASRQPQAQQGPILKPKPTSATLLVLCDLACDWKLDGEAKGRIEAGSSAKATVSLGQHMVEAFTVDRLDSIRKVAEVKTAGQTIADIQLKPVRDARLKSASDAQNGAAEQEAVRLKDLRDHAAERYQQAVDLENQKRYAEAKPLYEQSCDGGNVNGCVNLGWMYENGHGVAQDYAQALPLYQKACDSGSAIGCTDLGYLYDSGKGVARDYTQARILYQKGCDGGNVLGCSNLGEFYRLGQGGAQDYAQARTLDQKACDGGNANGCSNLGYLYVNGLGVPKDLAKGRELLQKGCSMGNQWGCDRLKELQ